MGNSRVRPGRSRSVTAAIVTTAVLALAACAPSDDPDSAPTPSATTTPPPAVDTSTLRTMIDTFDVADRPPPTLVLEGPAETLASERAESVSYLSGDATVTGVLRTPAGASEDRPAVVVVHGSSDPDTYESGSDLAPEQRALLDAGYVVLAVDMRGYAGSDAADIDSPAVDPGFGWTTTLDWGMALDVATALSALRGGDVASVDPERVGLLGHSLGGLLALDAAVLAPGTSDLVIALSAPSSDLVGMLAQYEQSGADVFNDEDAAAEFDEVYWADASPRTFFDRATEPLLLVHGGADDTTFAEWSQDTADAWTAAGNPAEAIILEGADHHFAPRRDEVVQIVVQAFDEVLGSE